MGKMTNRNARTGKLPILLIALTVLAAFQPALAETQDVEETRKKAERGHDRAQYKLGVMYATGEGVPEDHREAVKWFRKAAEQGVSEAQYNLGLMYSLGKGVLEDYVKAYAWTILASAQGHESTIVKDFLGPRMTTEQVAEAQKLAAELFKRIESAKSD